jgi:DNA-binding MarR family transcriptional regulator
MDQTGADSMTRLNSFNTFLNTLDILKKPAAAGQTEDELIDRLYAHLQDGPKSLPELIDALKTAPSDVLKLVQNMETSGLIKRIQAQDGTLTISK